MELFMFRCPDSHAWIECSAEEMIPQTCCHAKILLVRYMVVTRMAHSRSIQIRRFMLPVVCRVVDEDIPKIAGEDACCPAVAKLKPRAAQDGHTIPITPSNRLAQAGVPISSRGL